MTVDSCVGSRATTSGKRIYWKCLCDCGNVTSISSNNLTSLRVKTCGKCNRPRNNWSGYGDLSGAFWNKIKNSAKLRNINFDDNFTIEDAWELFLKQDKKCSLSGLDIKLETNFRFHIDTHTASLDRIDSAKDYTLNNVQWVHKDINLMKNELDQKTFLKYCEMIVKKSS